jgi:hypothetical protein
MKLVSLSYVRELVSSICAVLATEAFDVYDLGDLRDYAGLLAAGSPSTDRALIFDFREALNAKMRIFGEYSGIKWCAQYDVSQR